MELGLINYYKNLYDGYKIIYIRFLDDEFLFRTLSRKEYKYIYSSAENKYDIDERICQTCCLMPEDYDFTSCAAGLPEHFSNAIQEHSGLNDVKKILSYCETERNTVTLEKQAMDLIKAFIPEYTYEEMEDWTWEKLMTYTAKAERIAKYKGFDWHLVDQSDDYIQNLESMNSDNTEFVNGLYEQGIDPMMYFKDEIEQEIKTKRDIIDFPLITKGRWNDEGVLNVVRQQSRTIKR